MEQKDFSSHEIVVVIGAYFKYNQRIFQIVTYSQFASNFIHFSLYEHLCCRHAEFSSSSICSASLM